ncbi:MAG: RNA pseudouridine synthase [Candidatus Krumholzibacteria bacterium]|nr:RNA pseudouridine synthase [Candidatus Krumholzibacteria bacterium]MDH4337461.1 RNA pseudouridine synthase [Candidatus Krumholzibacteria bacterium]MDH5270159.1 RNA pseudouridine synthase [Candidatus Krumholzibacteria bacterium]
MTQHIQVLLEDNHLLGVLKPAGLLAQGDRTGDPTALAQARAYIKERYAKPGDVYLGLVHRIDRPVSGVMVFARTSKAASRLARAFHDRVVEKCYLAVVVGSMPDDTGELSGFIERTHTRSRMAAADGPRAREASLEYRVLARSELTLPTRDRRRKAPARMVSLVEINPRTGRHHQIRLQFSAAGFPLLGDLKYRAPEPLPERAIALHAARLRFPHPVGGETVELAAAPPDVIPWTLFGAAIARWLNSPAP